MDIIKKAILYAKKEYEKNDPMHRWSHIEDVMERALEIAEKRKDIDYELLNLAIIFHDIDYNSEKNLEENYKNHVDNTIKKAVEFLKINDYPKERIERVKQIMLDHSTPHRKKFGDSNIIEGKILYDADKSIFLTTLERYNKYFSYLYLDETRSLVKKPDN